MKSLDSEESAEINSMASTSNSSIVVRVKNSPRCVYLSDGLFPGLKLTRFKLRITCSTAICSIYRGSSYEATLASYTSLSEFEAAKKLKNFALHLVRQQLASLKPRRIICEDLEAVT